MILKALKNLILIQVFVQLKLIKEKGLEFLFHPPSSPTPLARSLMLLQLYSVWFAVKNIHLFTKENMKLPVFSIWCAHCLKLRLCEHLSFVCICGHFSKLQTK